MTSRRSTSSLSAGSPRRSFTPPSRARSVVPSGPAGEWDGALNALKSYGAPLATLALCGVGAVYFAKRMTDLETKVDVGRRKEVRTLNETDVRMIVQQMAKDGLINIPQWQQHPPHEQPRAPMPQHGQRPTPQPPTRQVPSSAPASTPYVPSSARVEPIESEAPIVAATSWKPKGSAKPDPVTANSAQADEVPAGPEGVEVAQGSQTSQRSQTGGENVE